MGNVLTNDELEKTACDARLRARVYELIKSSEGSTSEQISQKTGMDITYVQEILCRLKDDGFVKANYSCGKIYYFTDITEKPLDDYEHKATPRRKHEFIEFLSISEFAKLVASVSGADFEIKIIKSVKRYRDKLDVVKKRLPGVVSVVKTDVCNNKNLRYEPSSVLIIIKDNKVFGYNLGSLLEEIK